MENLLWILIPVAIILLFKYWINTPKGIGVIGEWKVKLSLIGEDYVINNLVVKGEDGRTSQIDHVVINESGIFVIETKNYSGKIFGGYNQLEWTQTLAGGRIKHKFYNPIKQNKTHVCRIKEIVGNDVPMFSIIVFVKANISSIKATCVHDIASMKATIRTKREIQITPEKIDYYHELLQNYKLQNKISKKEHISNIDKLMDEIDNNICPRCGAELIERTGPKGKFYGCSKYPKCRFTKKWTEPVYIEKTLPVEELPVRDDLKVEENIKIDTTIL